jgi:hypothetical protein
MRLRLFLFINLKEIFFLLFIHFQQGLNIFTVIA